MPRFGIDSSFVAIDFETADPKRDSACAVGLVKVENGTITERYYSLIRPPRKKFNPFCVRVHGITWPDVENEPDFSGVWPEMKTFMQGSDFLVAHNAPFDRTVMRSCCEMITTAPPEIPFFCTVQMSRQTFGLKSNKLNNVSEHLGISLDHHHAGSDAEACALIAVEGLKRNPDFWEI
ncbi:MAG: 3'-5' exonuclease [Desulfovibrio sp.]